MNHIVGHSNASELSMSDPTWKTKNLIRTLDLCLKRVKILFGLSQLDKDNMATDNLYQNIKMIDVWKILNLLLLILSAVFRLMLIP